MTSRILGVDRLYSCGMSIQVDPKSSLEQETVRQIFQNWIVLCSTHVFVVFSHWSTTLRNYKFPKISNFDLTYFFKFMIIRENHIPHVFSCQSHILTHQMDTPMFVFSVLTGRDCTYPFKIDPMLALNLGISFDCYDGMSY